MELRHLRYFVAAAEAGSLTSASRELRLAQPALSRQMRDLEEELGLQLFRRQPRGITLTPEGELWLGECREILARKDHAVARVRAVANGAAGELHIGYAPSPTIDLLPKALAIFQKLTPQVRVVLHDLPSDQLTEGLRTGELALSIMHRPSEQTGAGILFELLRRSSICVAMRPRHPLAKQKRIRFEQLAKEKLVAFRGSDYTDYRALVNRVLTFGKIDCAVASECDGSSSLFAELEAGRGVAILPRVFRHHVGKRLVMLPLYPAPPPHEVGLCRAVNRLRSVAADRFCEALRELKNIPNQKVVERPFCTRVEG